MENHEIMQLKFSRWFEANHDRLWPRYELYVQEMQDSLEHKRYLLNSDKCYEEWAQDIYEEERAFSKPALTIAQFKGYQK